MNPSITVVAVTCQKVAEHALAIQKTLRCLPFEVESLLVAPECPSWFDGNHVTVPELMPNGKWTIRDFNHFMVSELDNLIKTDFALTVHWDGYALNPECWSNEFLDYDYIGAPWPWWVNAKVALTRGGLFNRVGNGGFSLRSKYWLQAVQSISNQHTFQSEDAWACKEKIKYLKGMGCRVAPFELAQKFSFEHPTLGYPMLGRSFGFHGYDTMKRMQKLQLGHSTAPYGL